MAIYARQKRQTRFYWAEIGFMILGLLGLQPALFTSLLSSTPAKTTSYPETTYPSLHQPTLDSYKDLGVNYIANLWNQAQSQGLLTAALPNTGPVHTGTSWTPAPVNAAYLPSTSASSSWPPQYSNNPYGQWPNTGTAQPQSGMYSPPVAQQPYPPQYYAQPQSTYMAQSHAPTPYPSSSANTYSGQAPAANWNLQHGGQSTHPNQGYPSANYNSYPNATYQNNGYPNPPSAYPQSNYNTNLTAPQSYPAANSASAAWPNTFGANTGNYSAQHPSHIATGAAYWPSTAQNVNQYPYGTATPASNTGTWQRYQPAYNPYQIR
jgi:hypothetical protein